MRILAALFTLLPVAAPAQSRGPGLRLQSAPQGLWAVVMRAKASADRWGASLHRRTRAGHDQRRHRPRMVGIATTVPFTMSRM